MPQRQGARYNAMNKRKQALLYLTLDVLASYAVWLMFYVIRVTVNEQKTAYFESQRFITAGIISLYWALLYAVNGLYSRPFRKSRLKEQGQVFRTTLVGTLAIFFAVILDDPVSAGQSDSAYRFSFVTYFALQYLAVGMVRFAVSTRTNIQLRKRIIGFPTIIVGTGPTAYKLWSEFNAMRKSLGYRFLGCLSLPGSSERAFMGKLKRYGDYSRLQDVIRQRGVEEVIIAVEKGEHEHIVPVIDACEGTDVVIKVVPDMYDYLLGNVRMTHILGAPLIEIQPQILTTFEQVAKRAMDVSVSLIVLILLSPLYLILALAVKFDSRGPVFFRQERIGQGGKPFNIIKYRSMRVDAEKFGPALSKDNDPRITRVGKFLRKSRLDEFPQFWNVLIGEMSLVGPRPERQFYIDQILKVAPEYRHLQKVRPGITSWGQVKYGYASSVDEMVERLKYDLVYIENISLGLDLKIMLYTVIVMVEGRGK